MDFYLLPHQILLSELLTRNRIDWFEFIASFTVTPSDGGCFMLLKQLNNKKEATAEEKRRPFTIQSLNSQALTT